MDTDVAKRFVRVLEQFARYSADDYSAAAPAHTTIAARLGVGSPAVSNAVAALRARGLMAGDVVTVAGHEYLRTHRALVSASIPIAGKVQAGRSKTETLAVFIENFRELAYTEGPCLPLVSTRSAGGTVALEVRGASMESVRIFEGDYVIVELFAENEGPKEGDLIITRYVPRANVHDWQDGDADDDSIWDGPTVKYYFADGHRYWLSPRKDRSDKRYLIPALAVRPIGRVVSVYRTIT